MRLDIDNNGCPNNIKNGDLLLFRDAYLSKVASHRLRRWLISRIFRSSVDKVFYCRLINADFLGITKVIAVKELLSERFDIIEPRPVTEEAPLI